MSLFSLETERPADTSNIKFVKLGPELGKKKFHQFTDAVKKSIGVNLDGAVYSRICVEKSVVDGENYFEISLHNEIFLPIAGRQLPILERHAQNVDMSLVGYVDSLNFILNDSRIFS